LVLFCAPYPYHLYHPSSERPLAYLHRERLLVRKAGGPGSFSFFPLDGVHR
jgi:hypothetical protein